MDVRSCDRYEFFPNKTRITSKKRFKINSGWDCQKTIINRADWNLYDLTNIFGERIGKSCLSVSEVIFIQEIWFEKIYCCEMKQSYKYHKNECDAFNKQFK